MTSLKFKLKKLSILPKFYFHDELEQLKTNFNTNFRFKRVLGFVIEYAWISKLLRDTAFTWLPRGLNGFDFHFDLFWMAWHWKAAISCLWTVASITRTMYWTLKKSRKKAVYWLPKHRISVNFPCHLSQCCRLILIVTKRETALLLKKVKRMLYLYLRLCFVTLRYYTL